MDQERRKEKRIQEDFSILSKIYEKTELESDISKITDVSATGLSFVSDLKLTTDHLLHLILRLPPDFKQKIELFGRVVDSQPAEENKFKTHVAFIDIDEKTHALLAQYIQDSGF